MKRLDLVRESEQAGCVPLRHGGRHDIHHNPTAGRSEPVPRTPSGDQRDSRPQNHRASHRSPVGTTDFALPLGSRIIPFA